MLKIDWIAVSKEKKTFAELAKELNCSIRAITRNLKKLGLKKEISWHHKEELELDIKLGIKKKNKKTGRFVNGR